MSETRAADESLVLPFPVHSRSSSTMASFFHSNPSQSYPALSSLHFSPSSGCAPTSSSAYPNDHIIIANPEPFEPQLAGAYPHSQSDIYYATEQDGEYSYQLYPSSGSSWPASKKDKVPTDDHYYRQHGNRPPLPIGVTQYPNANYPPRHSNVPFIETTRLVMPPSRPMLSPITPDIEVAGSTYPESEYEDWGDKAFVPVSTSLRSHSLSNARTVPAVPPPPPRYPAIKQEDPAVFSPQGYFAAPQPHHALPPELCAFDLQSLYSGSSYDGSGPSSHHGTPTPMQSLPLPTPHSYTASMGYMYETLPQECYMPEQSPSEPSAPSLSPQMEYSSGCDPRFINGAQEAISHTVDRNRLVDEESEHPGYEVDRHKTVLQESLSDSNRGFRTDSNGIVVADAESDADAEGELDIFDQDDGEPEVVKHLEEQLTLRDRPHRRGRSSSSDDSTAHSTPPAHQGRTLRSRSVSGHSRFSPYRYSPPPASAYGRSTRARRATLAVSGAQSGPFLSDQQAQPSSSPPSPTVPTNRKRTRPATPLPIPIPVPNLTKKSRGRGVPTIATLEMNGRGRHTFSEDDYTESGKRRNGARLYTCKVPGCGKCFARGEHLKRHVRSIHTYEKPHKCPYPGCGKDFSRHDNLGQHMRVHKDYVPPKDARAYRA